MPTASKTRPTKAVATLPKPAIGAANEIYAGIAFEGGKPSHYLFLLTEKPDQRMNWKAAQAWAKSIGAELPTRFESALLYANLRDEFDTDYWHWTSTQSSAGYAWCQYFHGGGQNLNVKSFEALARAVRRLPL